MKRMKYISFNFIAILLGVIFVIVGSIFNISSLSSFLISFWITFIICGNIWIHTKFDENMKKKEK